MHHTHTSRIQVLIKTQCGAARGGNTLHDKASKQTRNFYCNRVPYLKASVDYTKGLLILVKTLCGAARKANTLHDIAAKQTRNF